VSGLFITGTDTGCGKTTVATLIARAARRAGRRVRVLKPIETGCEERDGELHPADALALAEAADDRRAVRAICPYRLRLPAAPDVAARHEGVTIDPEELDRAYSEAAEDCDLTLVEGAGGLLVPILPGLDMAGLAARFQLPLLVAARAALGTINHTWLTLEAAAARGLRVVAVAISHTTPELSPADRSNLERLLEDLPVPLLGELSYGGSHLVREPDWAGFWASLGAS
jgi:dethiobiotin synthetase